MTQAIELSSRESRRILMSARQAGRQVRLHPKSWPDSRCIIGALVDGPDSALEVEARPDAQADLHNSLTRYCQVELDLAEGQFFFDSHVVAVRQGAETVRLSLAWPQTILVLQRRSAGRSALARSSHVQISREEHGRLSTLGGRLYNLSQDGLAFKAQEPYAEEIEIGQTWSVCFEVPEQAYVYRLEGTVRRLLPSSCQGDVIVGVQFDAAANDAKDLDQLREFLNQRGRAGAAMGATP